MHLVTRDHGPVLEKGRKRNHSDLWVPYNGLVIRLASRVGMVETCRARGKDICRINYRAIRAWGSCLPLLPWRHYGDDLH